jgi:hypothetical protein
MPLNKLKREYEDRRISLVETLQKNKGQMELSKQHQLYGAIKEIENFLKAIDSAREIQIAGTDFELKREGPRPIATRASVAFETAGKSARGVFSGIGVAFNKHVVQRSKNAVKSTKRKIKIYHDVLKEVNKRSKEEDS